MLEKQFGSLGNFIKKRYKIIIAIWLIVVIVLLPFAAKSMTVTNYNVEFTGSSSNTMSEKAQKLYDAQFNGTSNNSSNGTAVVLYFNSSFFSNTSYNIWDTINQTYRSALTGSGIRNVTSPYEISTAVVNSIGNVTYIMYDNVRNASSSINSSYKVVMNGTLSLVKFSSNLKTIDSKFLTTYISVNSSVSSLTPVLQRVEGEIQGAADLIYGIPVGYVNVYQMLYASLSNYTSNSTINSKAETAFLTDTNNLGGNSTELGYFSLFYNSWNSTYTSGPINTRLMESVNSAFDHFTSAVNSTAEKDFYYSVLEGFSPSAISNSSEFNRDTLSLLYNITYPSSGNSTEQTLFNLTFHYFALNDSSTVISYEVAGQILDVPIISNFTIQFFNLTPSEFIRQYFVNSTDVNSSLLENQMNSSSIAPSIAKLSSGLNISSGKFYSIILENDTTTVKSYFINATAGAISKLSSAVGVTPEFMLEMFLSNGSENSSHYFASYFLENHFAGYPYFHFSDAPEFVNESLKSKGNISSIVGPDYKESGIALNSSLFHLLVPSDFSGFMVIFSFNESSLNGNELNIVNQYIYDIQSEFKNVNVYYTSSDEISHGLEVTAYNGLIYSLIVGIIISIVIVGVYFRSPFIAFVPLLFFLISFIITLGLIYIIYGIIFKSSLSFIVTTLSAILILGLSTDYSVYILNRFSREKGEGRFQNTIQWAGHAVFTSAITVILSYVVLSFFNIPLIGDGGVVNALGISISLGVAVTLLPSFLYMFRDRFKERKIRVNFGAVARASRKHRNGLLVALVVIFVASLIVYEVTPTSFDLFSLIPNNEGKIGYYAMVSAYGGDYLSPGFILLTFQSPVYSQGHFNTTEINILNNVSTTLMKDKDVAQIDTVTFPFGKEVNLQNLSGSNFSKDTVMNQSLSFIGKNSKTVLIDLYDKGVSFSQGGIDAISKVDTLLSRTVPKGTEYLVGGSAQGLVDNSQTVSSSTYRLVEILAIIIFFVLAYQLSSFLTPLRLLFNVGTSALLAVSISYAVFHYILNLPIIVFGPLFVIVTLFGVGLDYDIFLVTRTREAVMAGKNDEDAISEAITENAGVILVLGFILSGVFGSLIFSPIGIISQIGFSITVGVLVDTTVSWLFLIPALMLLLKKYNWWPSKIGKRDKI